MLSHEDVLNYIKDILGYPFVNIEWDDEKVIDFIIRNTLKEFSYYVPQKWKTIIDPNDDKYKVPDSGNEYYIFDENGLEIYNIIDIYFPSSNYLLHGHQPIGPLSQGEIREWALSTETSMMTKMFSSFDHTFEFKHPNMVRISPKLNNSDIIGVEYERCQPSDLSGINNDLHIHFKKMAAGDIMINLGRLRRKYSGGNLRTPFGEIPLDADILDEGKDMKREVIEELEKLFIPNIIIDHG